MNEKDTPEFMSCAGFTCPVCHAPINKVNFFSDKEYSLKCGDDIQPHYMAVIMKNGSNYREYFNDRVSPISVARYSPSNITMVNFTGGLSKPKYFKRLASDAEIMFFIYNYIKWAILA